MHMYSSVNLFLYWPLGPSVQMWISLRAPIFSFTVHNIDDRFSKSKNCIRRFLLIREQVKLAAPCTPYGPETVDYIIEIYPKRSVLCCLVLCLLLLYHVILF